MTKPAKRQTKRKQTQQLRNCVCGSHFSPMAYGHHLRFCGVYQAQCLTRERNARFYAAQATTTGSTTVAPQPPDMSMRQQRQYIQKLSAEEAVAAAQQQSEAHHAMYEANLRKITIKARSSTAGDASGTQKGNMDNNNDDDDGEGMDTSSDEEEEEDNEYFHCNNNNDDEWASNDAVDNDAQAEVEEPELSEASIISDGDNATLTEASDAPWEPIFPIRSDCDQDTSVQFKNQVAPCTAAGIQLMEVIGRHSVDLKLYDDIVQFIENLANDDYDFKQKIPKRHALHRQCEEVFNYSSLRPKLINVPVKTLDNPTVTMPVFDIQAVVSKMLRDPEKMQEENLVRNYDIFTGKPTPGYELSNDSYFYDEPHTGKQWDIALNHYCASDENAFPCGLVIFYDKSHSDR